MISDWIIWGFIKLIYVKNLEVILSSDPRFHGLIHQKIKTCFWNPGFLHMCALKPWNVNDQLVLPLRVYIWDLRFTQEVQEVWQATLASVYVDCGQSLPSSVISVGHQSISPVLELGFKLFQASSDLNRKVFQQFLLELNWIWKWSFDFLLSFCACW